MAAVPFPILRLPSSALQKSLKHMSIANLISISFLSKNTTEMIRMLENTDKLGTITLTPSVSLSLSLKWLTIRDFVSKPDQLLQTVKICRVYDSEELTIPEFTVKQFIDHIVHVFFQTEEVLFFQSKGVKLDIRNVQKNNLKVIQEYTKNLNIECLYVDSSEAEDVELLKLFPSLEELSVSRVRISDSVLIQNFRMFKLDDVNLNDILCSNSSDIIVDDGLLSNKDFNLLMKQWINGSNPRLQFVQMTFSRQRERLTQHALFEGIEYVLCLKRNYMEETVCEIKRNDGTQARICFTSEYRHHFRMRII